MPEKIYNEKGERSLWFKGDEIEHVILSLDEKQIRLFLKELGMFEFNITKDFGHFPDLHLIMDDSLKRKLQEDLR